MKNNKFNIIISSVVVLLPILFGVILWDKLPESMEIHWGADGAADGFGGKFFAVFCLPLIILILHFLCIFLTFLDKKQKVQNKKALNIIFWILPFVSLLSSIIVYSVALGREISFEILLPLLFAMMFIFLGNYLPKIKQNRTLGIKLFWTINNEENWNKTHRLGGKVWVIGGVCILLSCFLPSKVMIMFFILITILMILIPMVYSYSIYKKHKAEGITYDILPRSKTEKIIIKITAVIVPIILIGAAVLMFTGNIEHNFGKTRLSVKSTYYDGLSVEYDQIDDIELREKSNVGIRTFGFGSARLSLGNFENDEFGDYTRYTYNGCEAAIVIKSDNKILVLNGKNLEETEEIYNTLREKCNDKF